MKRNRNKIGILLVGLLMLSACSNPACFEEYQTISGEKWDMNKPVAFSVEMNDTINHYDVILHIRHTYNYPYQNLWLFTSSLSPDSLIASDTLSCFLADNTGKWLGASNFSTYDMPLLYMQNIRFPQPGNYQFIISQGMRDSLLIGVRNIGLSIEKRENVKE